MKASIKNIKLPDAPEPTRAAYKKPVVYTNSKHLRVVELPGNYPKPLPAPPKQKKRKTKAKREQKPRRTTPPKIWTPDKVERLTELYSQGVCYKDIATEFGVTYGQVAGIIDRLHSKDMLTMRQYQEKWTQDEIDELMKLKAAGHTWQEISEKLGRPTASCSNKWLNEVKK